MVSDMIKEPAMSAVPTIDPATTSAVDHLRRETFASPILRCTGLKSIDTPITPMHRAASPKMTLVNISAPARPELSQRV